MGGAYVQAILKAGMVCSSQVPFLNVYLHLLLR